MMPIRKMLPIGTQRKLPDFFHRQMAQKGKRRSAPARFLGLVIACLALAACQPQIAARYQAQIDANAQGLSAPTAPATAQIPSPAASPTAIVSPAATVSPTMPPTPTQTSTPTPISSPTADACASEPGQIVQMQVTFSDKPFSFRVYFPPCFKQDKQTRYPVLYMIHGQATDDEQWERIGIGASADRLIQEKLSPPFLIVMPQEDDTYENIYTGSFSSDFIDKLVPWIDANYPTCADRACRALGGLSRGGNWALHLGFTHWDLFSSIGLHSTPTFNGDPPQLSTWVHAIQPGEMPRIYIDIGKNDPFFPYASQVDKILSALNVPHEWTVNDGTHEEAYWGDHVAEYLQWYTSFWKTLPENMLAE